jgi:hypothetical protein
MKPLNVFQRIAEWFKSKFGKKQTKSNYVSDQYKIEMCQEAILNCICHHHCEVCAWNVESYTGVKNKY